MTVYCVRYFSNDLLDEITGQLWGFFLVDPFTLGKQDSKLCHEHGPTNNFLSLVWNITKLPHRIELDIPKNRMFFVFRFCYILAGK
jgi:hypothetical protein